MITERRKNITGEYKRALQAWYLKKMSFYCKFEGEDA
jgi:hypothetical protein